MKKVLGILIAVLSTNLGFAQGTVSFQANISNRNGDVIYIKDNMNKTIKEIGLNKEGLFSDKFEVKDGFYVMFDGVEYAQLYLKEGFDLKLKMDAKEFDESIVFDGKGSEENNFLAKSALEEEKYNYDDLLALDEDNFNKQIAEKANKQILRLEKSKFDAKFIELQKSNIEENQKGIKQYFAEKLKSKKLNNTKSVSFDYLNHAGGKTKLEDLAGKYVYIDVWATWCGPCRAEIPHLQKIEEKYHDKKIAFVSISVDVDKDFEKWKKFVTDKSLGGIQLFADKNWKSDFMLAYGINAIPRFILLDTKGNIIDADAKRPSDLKLQEQLDSLLK